MYSRAATTGSGEASAGESLSSADDSQEQPLRDVNTDSSMITDGTLTATAPSILKAATGFRREVLRLGGRVIEEKVNYHDAAYVAGKPADAYYRVKLLPRQLPDLLDWVYSNTTIIVQDVSSIVAMESEADAAIVRIDVAERLQAIDQQLAKPDVSPEERERLLAERAGLVGASAANPTSEASNVRRVAVLTLILTSKNKLDGFENSLVASVRGSILGVNMLGETKDSRLGVGISVGKGDAVPRWEVIGYASSEPGQDAGVLATVGFGTYSKLLGHGRRTSLNPFVGIRTGYAYLGESYFVVSGEIGIDVLRSKGVLWSVAARPTGLIGADSQAALEVGSSLGLAF